MEGFVSFGSPQPIVSIAGKQLIAADGVPLFSTHDGILMELPTYCYNEQGMLISGSWKFVPNTWSPTAQPKPYHQPEGGNYLDYPGEVQQHQRAAGQHERYDLPDEVQCFDCMNYPEEIPQHQAAASPGADADEFLQRNGPYYKTLAITKRGSKVRGQLAKPKKFRTPICRFCFSNKETSQIYKSHVLFDDDGKVVCPILREHICPLCGKTGDQAHTFRYCPLNDSAAKALSHKNTVYEGVQYARNAAGDKMLLKF